MGNHVSCASARFKYLPINTSNEMNAETREMARLTRSSTKFDNERRNRMRMAVIDDMITSGTFSFTKSELGIMSVETLKCICGNFETTLHETADDLGDVLRFQDELKCVNSILKTSRDKLLPPPL